jgi:hypothetical protein
VQGIGIDLSHSYSSYKVGSIQPLTEIHYQNLLIMALAAAREKMVQFLKVSTKDKVRKYSFSLPYDFGSIEVNVKHPA